MTPDPKTEALKPLPCPFCGETKVIVREASTFRWVVAICTHCGAMTGETRKQTLGEGTKEEWEKNAEVDAIKEWNTRAPVIERDAELAALREACDAFSAMIHCEECSTDGPVNISHGRLLPHVFAIRRALASTAGTDFAERLRKAEEERDQLKRAIEQMKPMYELGIKAFNK